MKPNCFFLRLDRSKMTSGGASTRRSTARGFPRLTTRQRLEETSNSAILQGKRSTQGNEFISPHADLEILPNLALKLRPFKNGYYRVLIGWTLNIFLMPLLLRFHRLLNLCWDFFGFRWEGWSTLSNGSVAYCL